MSEHEQNFLKWLAGIPSAERDALERGKTIAKRVVANAREARRYWWVWEGLNERLDGAGPLSQALQWHAPLGLVEIRWALAQSTVMAIMRITDPPKPASATACSLAGLLSNESVVGLVTSDMWLSGRKAGLPGTILAYEREEQPKRIEQFRLTVPLGWARADAMPDDDKLVKARVALKSIRDRSIAHSDLTVGEPPTIDEVRDALEVSMMVAQLGSLIFLGHSSGLDLVSKPEPRDGDVWHYFESGMVSAHVAWKTEAGS